jgi:hypothetical protein
MPATGSSRRLWFRQQAPDVDVTSARRLCYKRRVPLLRAVAGAARERPCEVRHYDGLIHQRRQWLIDEGRTRAELHTRHGRSVQEDEGGAKLATNL